MGVDAEMFARIKGRKNWLPETEELAAAYELASTIGYDKFLITKGGDHAWSQHHALEIMRPIKDAEDARDHGLPRSMIGKVVWTQDGDEIVAADDEQFIRVHLWSRYYGEGYARGDWPTIRAVAEWLEVRFPGCEVWYGGDSSGMCAELFDAAARDKLNRFYLSSGRSTYTRGGIGSIFGGHDQITCPCCEVGMVCNGGGRGDSMHYCDGCGKQAIRLATGYVHFGDCRKDSFDLMKEARAAAGLQP